MVKIMGQNWRSVVPLERNLYGHPLAGLLWERQFEQALELGWGEIPNGERMFVHQKTRVILSVDVDDIKIFGKKQNLALLWKKSMKNGEIEKPTSFLDHVKSGCTQRECKPNEAIIEQYTQMFESGHSDLGILSNLGASSNFTWV